jgi:hypothetical protein
MTNNQPQISVELERNRGFIEDHYNQPEITNSPDDSSEVNQQRNSSILNCNYCEKKIQT